MKRTFLSLLGLFAVIHAFTQNVGIGTANPVVNLHVTAATSPGQTDGNILITNGITGHTIFDGLRIRMNSSTASLQNSENGDFFLQTNQGASGAFGSPAIWIKPTGAIGIGTSTPDAKLEVAGQVKITGGSPGVGKVLTSDATGLGSWTTLAGGSQWTTSGNHIYNANSGFVGVGTNTPGHSLHVHHNGEGGVFDASIQLTNNWSGNTVNDGLRIRIVNESTVSILNRENGDISIATNFGATGAYGTPGIWIKPSGAMGIGTSTPGAKLEISGVGALLPALNINNGFMKVSGENKTAFTVTGTVANTSTYFLYPGYANQSASDILIVTHNYNPPGVGGTYLNVPVGVYWDGIRWGIYSEDSATPMLGKSFNVLVVKQ